MFVTSIVTKIIGSSNQRTVKKLSKIVKVINSLEPQYADIKDEDLWVWKWELIVTPSEL